MDYEYEQLGDVRFQKLCQALVSSEYPGLQCFPVRQPDGGRDMAQWHRRVRGESVIFQVKFVERPQLMESPHKWLTDILQSEAPKLKKQIPKGARKYILLTNVAGTAHPDRGSIDKVHTILNDSLPVPAIALWRDDLNRRLDVNWDLKWVYPELMTGPDLLRALIESGLSEDKERRASAVRAFLATQFRADAEIKFKQVELQNALLDLFVDVPALPRYSDVEREDGRRDRFLIRALNSEISQHRLDEQPPASDEDEVAGAASFLLHELAIKAFPFLVLEGGPGQGKSTIAQYVCQVHRMRLLNRTSEISYLGSLDRESPVRLPFKVDLRDFATWLKGGNPLEGLPGKDQTSSPRSLESFLAAQIHHHSGGVDFSVADLHAVARTSALLVMLDGFDEVAEITERELVVEEVIKAISRLRESTVSLQVVVTSRPAAFSNSPGFPTETFRYCELRDLTKSQILEYSRKWSSARSLDSTEHRSLTTILEEGLVKPHLRDLARNPMQLAILLSLIRQLGSSLPDKRTALYDAYVRLFFDREGEKTRSVKEHRELLIDMHRYLGWTLHSRAELDSSQGRISEDTLQNLLSAYLIDEGRDPSVATSLFHTAIDRVVFLVSRVEGTFEFEVQPLREYFAARHLYETAAYSPPGQEQPGTKPDIFQAICRNFYWLNVTRFFAGCYSKGELPSLVDCLQDLAADSAFEPTDHPRLLGSMLLSDRVFSQNAKSQKAAVGLCLDAVTGNRPMNGLTRYRPVQAFQLPTGAGQEELAKTATKMFSDEQRDDYRNEFVDLVKANSSLAERLDLWSPPLENEAMQSLEIAERLEILSSLPKDTLERLIDVLSGREYELGLRMLIEAGRVDICLATEARATSTVHAVLSHPEGLRIDQPERHQSPVQSVAIVFGWHPLGLMFRFRLRDFWFESNTEYEPMRDASTQTAAGTEKRCGEILGIFQGVKDESPDTWRQDLRPWNEVIEPTRDAFGELWGIRVAALVAAGIKARDVQSTEADDLFDQSIPLCSRARYARLRAGSPGWWSRQLEAMTTSEDAKFLALAHLVWASPRTLMTLGREFSDLLDNLTKGQCWELLRALTLIRWISELRNDIKASTIPREISPRFIRVISERTALREVMKLYERDLQTYSGNDPLVLELCQSVEARLAAKTHARWPMALKRIQGAYGKGGTTGLIGVLESPEHRRRMPDSVQGIMPYETARSIVVEAPSYPYELVAIAEARCRLELNNQIAPVARTAQQESWVGVSTETGGS